MTVSGVKLLKVNGIKGGWVLIRSGNGNRKSDLMTCDLHPPSLSLIRRAARTAVNWPKLIALEMAHARIRI